MDLARLRQQAQVRHDDNAGKATFTLPTGELLALLGVAEAILDGRDPADVAETYRNTARVIREWADRPSEHAGIALVSAGAASAPHQRAERYDAIAANLAALQEAPAEADTEQLEELTRPDPDGGVSYC